MKKFSIVFLITVTALLSCEKDDICIENTTPKLIIGFNNYTNKTDIKEVTIDSIWALNNSQISEYKAKTIDSIAIPLNLTEDFTTYIIQSKSKKDTINFTYTRKDVFVSRSCGYKTIFENLQIKNNTIHWIKEIEINNSTIDNETATHITIYH